MISNKMARWTIAAFLLFGGQIDGAIAVERERTIAQAPVDARKVEADGQFSS